MAASRIVELLPGDIGPTGRPLPAFPEPKPLTQHGPARIVAVCNQKGGVGKTTTTINLGAALAEQGRRMLLVDFDPQGALSVGLGIQPHDIDSTVYNLLMERGVKAHDVIFETGVPNLDLLPSNIDLSGAEVQLVHEVGREFILGGALKQVVPDYDYILIDCQPSLGLLTINALACADSVLIPLECEYFAMRGVALLMETIDKVQQRLNPHLQIDGLLGTMYDSRTLHTREVLGSIVNGFGDKVFHTVINRTVRFPDATVAGEPITTFDTSSMGASSYRELAKEVLDRWQAGDGHAVLSSDALDLPLRGKLNPLAKRKSRVSVPGVAELFRPAVPMPVTSDERQATGREKHDQKITVYLSATELLDLEHARLMLRRFGFVLDRGRLVREAIAILLADLDARGKDSLIARRIRAARDADQTADPDAGLDEDSGIPDPAVPSLAWAQLLVAR